MRKLTDLLYETLVLRNQAASLGIELPPDFRQHWTIENSKAIDL